MNETIASLTDWADEIRTSELLRVEGKLAALSPADRDLVERLTARIVRDFLEAPIAHMRRASTASSGVEYASVVEYLFGVGEDRP